MKIVCILICLLTFSCKSQETRFNSEIRYFEGIVHYELNYEPIDDRFNELELKESIGDRIEMSFKNGNYQKKYYSSDGSLLREIFLNLNEKKTYLRKIGNDTIFWVDISVNNSKSTFRKIKDSLIINEPTIGISTNTIIAGLNLGDQSFTVKGEIYFSKNLKLDPGWYSNYLEGNFNEQVKVGKGIQLLLIIEGPYWTRRTTARAFEHKEIRDEEILFKPERNAIFKQL